jgi:cytochrome c oxidase cbb3-type subunit III
MQVSQTRADPVAILAAALAGLSAVGGASAQSDRDPVERTVIEAPVDPTPGTAEADDALDIGTVDIGEGVRPNALLHVPVTGIFPNFVRPDPDLGALPVDDPAAAYRGMGWFNQFNCVGCHAPNGAGGMGPSLSNASFKYGGDPANIYLTILQGRPLGMPAWGGILPDHIIWDLVAYVQAISEDDTGGWGRTVSLEAFEIEQVPAQYMTTVEPWSHTQGFSYGRPPFVEVEPPEKPE